MSKQLLHTSQVRPALKQVCRRAVSQPVWTQVGGVGYGAESAMNDLAGGPSAQPSTPHADEQGVSGFLGGEYGSTDGEPVPYRAPGRLAIGDGALLAALAHHSHDPAIAVEVGTIESDELTDSDAGRDSNSSTARSRTAIGSSAPASSATASSNVDAWSWRSTSGRARFLSDWPAEGRDRGGVGLAGVPRT